MTEPPIMLPFVTGARFSETFRRHRNADTVSEFRFKVRRWQVVHVIAPNMEDFRRKTFRHRQFAQRDSNDGAHARGNADIVRFRPVLGEASGVKPARRPAASLMSLLVETKANFCRPITPDTGRVRAEERVVGRGRAIITAEGKILDASGRLIAHGGSTLMAPKPG